MSKAPAAVHLLTIVDYIANRDEASFTERGIQYHPKCTIGSSVLTSNASITFDIVSTY
ncbi:MAG: hypothetical protein ACR5LD_00560 [Symbiopectobacterium sp.]